MVEVLCHEALPLAVVGTSLAGRRLAVMNSIQVPLAVVGMTNSLQNTDRCRLYINLLSQLYKRKESNALRKKKKKKESNAYEALI